MHPEMKKKLDEVVQDLTSTFNVPRKLVEVQVNHCLIRAKLDVLGANVKDKTGKVDVKDSCEKIGDEVSMLVYLASEVVMETSKPSSDHPAAHNTLMQLGAEVVKAVTPIIHQYFLGIEPGRKPS